ncbi:MAG: GtrA family protein [Patescibacteria group bacterium]
MSLNFSPALIQLTKFILVGASGLVVDFGIYTLLTRFTSFGQNNLVAVGFIATLLANFNNFYWHRYFTFSELSTSFFKQYLKFLTASVLYLAGIQFTFWGLMNWLTWYDLSARAVAVAIWALLYYLVLKSQVFNSAEAK